MRIGVSLNVVAVGASLIVCSILTAPFNYLGVKVGSNMSRITSWDDVIFKVLIGVLNHLESIRRNFFYGVDGSDRKLAWIGWNMWAWRFLTDGSSLWTRFIKTIFVNKGALDTHKLIPRRSPWMPRGGVEQENYGLLCSKVVDLMLSNISDRWCWFLEGSQEFSVKSFRILIDNTILPKAEVPTRWLKVVSIKVNVHGWRVCLDKLPTRANLLLRGMDIPSIVRPFCNSAVESSSHIFSLVPWLAKFGHVLNIRELMLVKLINDSQSILEFEEDPKEDSEEDPEEELEVEAEDDVPPPATSPVGSPITPPSLSEFSSDTEDVAPIVANEALEIPPIGCLYEVGGPSSVSLFPSFYLHRLEIARLDDNTKLLLSNVKYLEQCGKKRKAEMEANSYEIRKVKKCMNEIGRDLGDEMQFSNLVENRVTKLEDKDQEKAEEMEKKKKRLGTLETNYALVLSHRDEWKKAFYNLQAWVSKRFGRGAMDARLDDGVSGSAAFGESIPPKPPRSPSSSQ
nr:RNA-directed DNA polymerase, eukaryota [Tanacetum cinerariifolium]